MFSMLWPKPLKNSVRGNRFLASILLGFAVRDKLVARPMGLPTFGSRAVKLMRSGICVD